MKQEVKNCCNECLVVVPIIDQFTRCADGAPLLGRCPEKEFAFLLDDEACGSFKGKI